MQIHRIRTTDIRPSNISFSHQQSINANFEPKHKKKCSLYQKPSRTINGTGLKSDDKQTSTILKNQALTSCLGSVQLGHSTHSASKLSRAGQKNIPSSDIKKQKKGKHTISVINLAKTVDESKGKNSTNVTKRKQSTVNLGDKIKQKVQDFRIIANCLDQYVKEERKNNIDANICQIIKIITAFNRAQIGPLSKPLQTLIGHIVNSIQQSLPQTQLKSILKKSISFDSPKRHITQQSEQGETVKKGFTGKDQLNGKKKQQITEDCKKLQENLGKLKYESNRLKYFFEQISAKNQQGRKKHQLKNNNQVQKLQELKKLKQIAKQQQKIIKKLQNSSNDNTFRSDSP